MSQTTTVWARVASAIIWVLAGGFLVLALSFHDGSFRIAIELGVPIVPVAVTGLYDVLHKGSLIIRPGHEIIVYVEEPIATDGLTTEDVPELRDHVRDLISARVEARRSPEIGI